MSPSVEAVTRGIRVQVVPEYMAQRSAPERNYYFFAYHITVANEGSEPAQLVSRQWTITDGLGRVEEVNGPGVVGEQPRIEPGEAIRYTSYCPLPTEVGSMAGAYQMVTDGGEEFEAQIPAFTLAAPNALN